MMWDLWEGKHPFLLPFLEATNAGFLHGAARKPVLHTLAFGGQPTPQSLQNGKSFDPVLSVVAIKQWSQIYRVTSASGVRCVGTQVGFCCCWCFSWGSWNGCSCFRVFSQDCFLPLPLETKQESTAFCLVRTLGFVVKFRAARSSFKDI